MLNSNQDIYRFALELQRNFNEKSYSKISKAIENAFNSGFTSSEQLGELKIIFQKIKDGWGEPSHDLKITIEQAIENGWNIPLLNRERHGLKGTYNTSLTLENWKDEFLTWFQGLKGQGIDLDKRAKILKMG